MGNIPITKTIPVGETVLTTTEVLPTGKQTNDEKKASPTPSVTGGNDSDENGSPSYTVISVPTTIHTVMNGVSAQILSVIPVTSALPVNKAPFDANAWQAAEASRSGLTTKPMLPSNHTTVKGSTSSRLPVVTAGAPGIGSSDGVRVAFLIFVAAWFF